MSNPHSEPTATQGDSVANTKLVRGLGLSQSIALNIANMVGIGPFITIPLFISAMHGPQALIAWVIAAILVICDGLIWSELGAALPGSGGTYHFLREIFGKQSSRWARMLPFLYVWQFLVSGTMEIASGYTGAIPYLEYVWPELPNFLESWNVPGGTRTLAASCCLIVTWFLSRRIEVVGWVGLSFARNADHGFDGHRLGIDAFQRRSADVSSRCLQDQWRMGTRPGCGNVDRHLRLPGLLQHLQPGRRGTRSRANNSRAVIISVVLVAVLYLTMNLSIIAVVPWEQAMKSGQIAALFMETIYGRQIAVIFTGLILWTVVACVFSVTLGYSRIPFAAAMNGDFLPIFSRVHPTKHYPTVSLWTIGFLTAAFCYLRLDTVIDTAVTVRILVQFVAQIAGLHLLRTTRPDIVMPFRMWFYPIPSLIALVGWLFVLGNRIEYLWPVTAVIVSGVIVYFLFVEKPRIQATETGE